jgi:hypothetical protein
MPIPGRGRADYFAPGDWNVACSMCGRKRKASSLVRNWQGLYRCLEHNEPRQPQDFARGVKDIMTVPFAQPETNLFVTTPGQIPVGLTTNHLTLVASGMQLVTLTGQSLVTLTRSPSFVTALIPHGFNRTGAPTTSPTFTPVNNGDYLIVASLGSAGAVFTVTGTTGTFTQISGSYFNDGQGDQIAFAENLNASAVSQHYTVQLGGFGFSTIIEYAGVGSSSSPAFVETLGATPTPGSISGTPVVVPMGATLLCFVFDNSGVGGTLNPVAPGVIRDVGNNFTPWILADFPGTGASITPKFTPNTTGGNFGVLQVILNGPAGGNQPLVALGAVNESASIGVQLQNWIQVQSIAWAFISGGAGISLSSTSAPSITVSTNSTPVSGVLQCTVTDIRGLVGRATCVVSG